MTEPTMREVLDHSVHAKVSNSFNNICYPNCPRCGGEAIYDRLCAAVEELRNAVGDSETEWAKHMRYYADLFASILYGTEKEE